MHTGSDKAGNRVELVIVAGKAMPRPIAAARGLIPNAELNVKAGGSTGGSREEKPELKEGTLDDCHSVPECAEKHGEEIADFANKPSAVPPSKKTNPLDSGFTGLEDAFKRHLDDLDLDK